MSIWIISIKTKPKAEEREDPVSQKEDLTVAMCWECVRLKIIAALMNRGLSRE
jgi:hypothetical protein